MAIHKSINELMAEANANFPDNTSGLISPADLRNFVLDFLEAMSPAYGYLTIGETPVSVTVGTTPTKTQKESKYRDQMLSWLSRLCRSRVTRNTG